MLDSCHTNATLRYCDPFGVSNPCLLEVNYLFGTYCFVLLTVRLFYRNDAKTLLNSPGTLVLYSLEGIHVNKFCLFFFLF